MTRTVIHWHKLSREIVDIRVKLDGALSSSDLVEDAPAHCKGIKPKSPPSSNCSMGKNPVDLQVTALTMFDNGKEIYHLLFVARYLLCQISTHCQHTPEFYSA